MLKYGFLDLVYCNCMCVPMDDDNKYIVCSSIEDYIQYDQHRSNLVMQVQEEDLKSQKDMYGTVIVCNRLKVTHRSTCK